MKIKYKFSPIWVLMAVIWLMLTLFLLNNYVDKVDVSILPFIVVPPAIIAVYYLCMPLINYIVVDEDKIMIHKSFIIFKNKVTFDNLHHCSIMTKDFVVFSKHEDVFPIHMDWMKKADMLALAEHMSQKCRIEDKERNGFSIKNLEDML